MIKKILIKDNIIKAVAVAVFAIAMACLLLYANHDRPKNEVVNGKGTEYETAKVLEVVEDHTTVDHDNEDVLKGSMKLKLKILSGRYKGDTSFITNNFSALYNVKVKAGDTISVRVDTTETGVYNVSVYNYNRAPVLLGLVVVFFLALAIVGRWQGVKAFIGLAYTLICVCFILLPLVLKGYPPLLLTVGIIFFTSAVCFIMIGGIQTKTVTAAIGSMCGILIAALMAQIFSKLAGVTIFQTNEAEALLVAKSSFQIHMRGLFISGILIASMGAIMDLAITISSAIEEIYNTDNRLEWKSLYRSGMKIGRDAMGTMANTLVLAFVGSSLSMMVLIYSYGVSFTQLINTDFVGIELIRSIAGCIGIIFAVPCVALISALGYGVIRRK